MGGYLQWLIDLLLGVVSVVVHLSIVMTSLWISSTQNAISENCEACLPQQSSTIGAAESIGMGIMGNRMKVNI